MALWSRRRKQEEVLLLIRSTPLSPRLRGRESGGGGGKVKAQNMSTLMNIHLATIGSEVVERPLLIRGFFPPHIDVGGSIFGKVGPRRGSGEGSEVNNAACFSHGRREGTGVFQPQYSMPIEKKN